MKRFTYAILALLGFAFVASPVFAQGTCDFPANMTNPTYAYTKGNGTPYTTFTPGSQNWDIDTSSIAITYPYSPLPKVLHTNGIQGKSPDWLISPKFLSAFPLQYNSFEWTMWMGRRSNNGQNGGNSDASRVWLYVNMTTGLDDPHTTGLEGLYLWWHHDNNQDIVSLREIHGGVDTELGSFTLLTNLSDYEWGATFRVKRIPSGNPTGSTVEYQVYSSTPDPSTTNFISYTVPADTDPATAFMYLRLDVTYTNTPWYPSSADGYFGVHSQWAGTQRKDAAEYNQICFIDLGPQPVELTSFNANFRNDQVVLNWHTATEINNYGFEIERSIEHDGNWETIGFVDGHGTSDSPNDYKFTDDQMMEGAKMIAYRLKQINRDGTSEYSNTILVSIPASADVVMYNFPNPFNPTTNINFTLLQDANVDLAVYNASGKKVSEIFKNEAMKSGFHTASFDGSSLPSGTYFYRLTTPAGTLSKSMILSK